MRRTKNAVKEYTKMKRTAQTGITHNSIPKKIVVKKFGQNKIIPITEPVYKDVSDYVNRKDCHPFVEVQSNDVAWLQTFSDGILSTKKDVHFPLLNSELDITNPEISGFRVYLSDSEFIHIQVQRVPKNKSMYQLDYFESTDTGVPQVLMVIIVDVSENSFASIDMVYASSKLELIDDDMSKYESNLEYARRIATFFKYVQVYMRNWDYALPNANHCVITPLLFFGKDFIEVNKNFGVKVS